MLYEVITYRLTVSCYQANEAGEACGVCDSCRLRAKGFAVITSYSIHYTKLYE